MEETNLGSNPPIYDANGELISMPAPTPAPVEEVTTPVEQPISEENTVDAPVEIPPSGRENAKKNLMPPWKPGQSGNPKGRKKGTKNYSTIMRRILDSVETGNKITLDGEEVMVTNLEMIMYQLVKLAKGGELGAIRTSLDRALGAVPQKIEEEKSGEITVNLKIIDHAGDQPNVPEVS